MIPTHLHHLLSLAAERDPEACALRHRGVGWRYADVARAAHDVGAALLAQEVPHQARVALWLPKGPQFVAAAFGASRAGAAFVPVNPVFKAPQVGHVVRDSGAQVLVVSAERYGLLLAELREAPDLALVVVVGEPVPEAQTEGQPWRTLGWDAFLAAGSGRDSAHRTVADQDMAAILYTSGSTGKPKGVVLSHRNMVSGAISVATYLDNRATDRILAVLPFSFDAGFSQLTTGFHAGATVVMLDYLLPRDVISTMVKEQITGMTGVPPLYAQLAELDWPDAIGGHLRYFATTGGRMPRALLDRLRRHVPQARPYLMYGLTEAFRSTYLPPEQVDARPDSMGIAIPNQQVLVIDGEGRLCAPGETGELVHRGSTVALGYWRDPERTSRRFRPLPPALFPGQPLEIAVWSGDLVRQDEEGYLYFVGRNDDMIKSSGYRISPTELEEVAYATGLVAEAAAIGIEDARLGQSIVLVAVPARGADVSVDGLVSQFRAQLPAYMVPGHVELREATLPRNPNGKIDRRALVQELSGRLGDGAGTTAGDTTAAGAAAGERPLAP